MSLETILGTIMIIVGIAALWFVANAKGRFPEESELKTITRNLFRVIVFLIAFSVWHVVREAFHLKKIYGEIIEYPEYIFIMLAYIMLFVTARRLYKTAKGLGITSK